MAFTSKINVFCTALLIASSAYAADTDFSVLEKKEQALSEKLKTQDAQIQKLSSELEKLSKQISNLKQKKSAGLMQGFRLERYLKDAQLLSDRLEQIKSSRKASQSEFNELEIVYADALDHEIARQQVLASELGANISNRKLAAQKIELLLQKRMRFDVTSQEAPLPQTGSLTNAQIDPADTQDRINALHDFERRLTKDVEGMNQEIDRLKSQQFVRNEISHLLEEESFFSEQNFVRGGVTRNTKPETTLALAQNQPSATGDTPGSIPITTRSIPNVEADTTSQATQNNAIQVPQPSSSPVETLNSIKSAATDNSKMLESAQAEQQKASLISLATELGMDAKEIQILTAALSNSPTGNRKLWLENRLYATKTILKRIQEIEKNLAKQSQ